MTEVIMPKMGDGMEEGTLLEWLKKDGESVKPGEVIGTIQTDKATLELESPGTLELESPGRGKLTGFLIQSGDTVPVGRPIAAILKDGESLPANWGSGEASAPAAAPAEEAPAQTSKAPAEATSAPATTSSNNERIKASPLARRVAADAGVDLSAVTGSGPGGRIVHKDVVAAIGQQGSSMPSSVPKSAPVTASAEDVKAAPKM